MTQRGQQTLGSERLHVLQLDRLTRFETDVPSIKKEENVLEPVEAPEPPERPSSFNIPSFLEHLPPLSDQHHKALAYLLRQVRVVSQEDSKAHEMIVTASIQFIHRLMTQTLAHSSEKKLTEMAILKTIEREEEFDFLLGS
jgi:hypothetical protein